MSIPLVIAWAGSLALTGLVPRAHQALADDLKPSGSSIYQQVTGEDSDEDRRQWDSLYNTGVYIYGKEPAALVRDHIELFPVGRTLDIAMGEGRNAVFLAKKGFKVDGVDYSNVAIRKAKRLARENGVSINAINADLTHYAIRPESYDLIVNIDFLQRSLVTQIKRGLKKGGVVVFENATLEQASNPGGEQIRKDFLLKRGELRELFKEFQVLYYREANDGKDARAGLIARKP